jgi:hypothetical protein
MTARRILALGIATLCLTILACGGGGGGGASAGSSNTWVGKVEGTDAYAAMLIKGTTRYVYVTDGKEVTFLFRGEIGETDPNNYFTLRDNASHVINVQAPQGNTFRGLITVGAGQHLAFSVSPAKGEAGLYRAKEGTAESAWIVLEDGTFRGAKVGPDSKVETLTVRGGVKWTDPATDP